MASGEGSGTPGADQSLQDMAASWQPLIDSVNRRRQPAPATPRRKGNLLGRIFGGHHAEILPAAAPAPAAPEPALTPETRGNPFTGVFQGAISMLRDRVPGLPSGEAATGYLAEQFRQKASLIPTFGHSLWEMIRNPGGLVKAAWESKTEIVTGAAVGMITKEAAKWAFNMILAEPGTLLARAGVGAVGGAAVAGVKELRRQNKEYRQFSAELGRDLGRNFNMNALALRFDALLEQHRAESDGKKRELLSDQLRYMSVKLKKDRWEREGVSRSKKEVLDEFLTHLEAKGGSEQYNEGAKEAIRRKIEQASSIQLGRLGKKVMRGAAFGAAGAIAGGLLVDFITSHLESAPLPSVPSAGATPTAAAAETATPAPAPTETPAPPTATATPEPTATATPEPPKPTATPFAEAPRGAPVVPPDQPPAVPATPQAPAGPEQLPAPPATAEPQAPAASPAPATPTAPEPAPAVPAAVSTESLPPTTAPNGAEVSGSVADNSLTYDGKPWVLMDNGVKNIGNLFKAVGESGDIDKQALASSLQNATKLWTDGQLNYADHPDLYRIFHLSNGTASLYNNLLDDNTLESLKKLGIFRK